MPLPINSTLSLFGASRPGDAIPSKPKKAMLVRMSSEILDALEASVQPLVQFDFSETPSLHVGETSFPMAHLQETAMHELYLRAASATKKNAPLKLYANVIGKFTIEQREIGNDLRDKIRESTQDAAAQKNSRATVFIDTPPETQPVNRKRKDAPMFHKPLRQSDKVKSVPSASSTPVSKPTPTHLSSTNQQGGVPVRKRFVHCLARGEKSEEELFKLIGADRSASLRAVIVELLDELAELKTDKPGRLYKLKPVGWKEVRPFEWPGLSEQERIQLARTGRLTLKNLRIPESDPLWAHFHYKKPTVAFAGSSTSSSDGHRSSTSNAPNEDKQRQSATDAPKRGVSSRELKEKKKKPKVNPKAEIQMKDESQRALKRPTADGVAEGRRTTVDAPQESSSLRSQPPPSTRQAKPPLRRDLEKEPSSSLASQSKPSTSHNEKLKPQEIKRLRDGDLISSDIEKGRVKVKERIPKKEPQDDVSVNPKPKLMKRKAVEDAVNDKPIRKSLDEDYPNSSGSLKRKARDDPEGINPKPQKRLAVPEDAYAQKPPKLKTREDDEHTSSKPKVSSKRKAEIDDDDYEPVRQKKPRPDRDSISSTLSSSRDDKQRKEYGANKKSSAASRMEDLIVRTEKTAQSISSLKIRKASPSLAKSNPLLPGKETDQRRSSSHSGSTSKHTKLRRKSPIYTSTEDEKEEPAKNLPTLPVNDPTTAPKTQKPLPEDDDLRARYNTTYVEYLSVMQKLLVQKGRLESFLKRDDFSDSEGDSELLPPEELEVLTSNHKRLCNELQAIRDTFGCRTKGST